MPRLLKEAIILAAELEGQNQHGKDKLVGFLRMVARQDLRSFVMRFCQVSRQTRVRVLPIVAFGSEVTHHLVPIARFGARPDRTAQRVAIATLASLIQKLDSDTFWTAAEEALEGIREGLAS